MGFVGKRISVRPLLAALFLNSSEEGSAWVGCFIETNYLSHIFFRNARNFKIFLSTYGRFVFSSHIIHVSCDKSEVGALWGKVT